MENIAVDNAFIKKIRQLITEQGAEELDTLLKSLYPPDIAAVLNRLGADDSRYLMEYLEKDRIVKVLVEMEDTALLAFLSSYSPKEIADDFIQNMDSDDAVSVLGYLPLREREEVISNLTDIEFAS